jgi:hypothetical protein
MHISATASSSASPCSWTSERQVVNASAWAIAPRVRCNEGALDRVQVAIDVPQPALHRLDERLVPQQARVHALGASVERVQVTKGTLRSLRGSPDRGPGGRVGRRVGRAPVRRAGFEERVLVRKVAVDRRAAHACALGDRRNRSPCRSELLVQFDRALGDSPARQLLELRAPLHSVGTLLIGHISPINIDRSAEACHLS